MTGRHLLEQAAMKMRCQLGGLEAETASSDGAFTQNEGSDHEQEVPEL